MDPARNKVRRLVEMLSERMNTPAPKVRFTESSSPAKAGSRALWGRGKTIVSSGFLNLSAPDEEMEGILAHELIHIQKRHSLRGLVIFWLLGGSVAVGLVFTIYTLPGVLTAYVSGGVMFLFLKSQALLSRHYEYEADERTRRLTNPMFLIRALERLKPYQTLWGRITHPPLEKRIDRLKRLGSASS